jgi:isoquinoline 1-oxidoreductase beta subunit
MKSYSRRDFIKASSNAAGGLLLAFHLPVLGKSVPYEPWPDAGSELNAWLAINVDNTITIRVAMAEMGQGVMTALPMIIAEELEADWRLVRVEYADVNRHIRDNNAYGKMLTDNSGSVRHSRKLLQSVGAEARERLIKAAAERWLVPNVDCYADYGKVYNRKTKSSFSYVELAAAAAQMRVGNIKIKTPEDFNSLGLPTPRVDVPAKVDGTAVYSIDIRRPGMVYAAVKHCPVIGGTVRSLRYNAIRNRPAIIKTVRMETAVAVVAEHFWQAKTAADELPVQWVTGELAKASSQQFRRSFETALDGRDGVVLEEHGHVVNNMDIAETTIESDYVVPYLSHACLEPMNCTVEFSDGRVDVWAGVQDPVASVNAISKVSGLPRNRVYLHNCFMGGGFGRRSQTDFVREAVLIAMDVGLPVQMIWTREEDQRSGQYRPMSASRFKAGFDLDKKLIVYTNHSVTHSIAQDQSPGEKGIDATSVEGLFDMPYRVEHRRISHASKNTNLTSWYWRSRGHSQNAYAMECFMDEMAVAANQDPIDFRMLHLRDKPAHRDVLEILKDKSNWRKSLPRGSAKGIALHESFGTICGQVAEVTVSTEGELTVDRIVCVVDCGNLINPSTAESQVESAIVFGLSAARYSKISVENGVVLEDNYDLYDVVRMADMPQIEVHFALSGGDKWGGLGEPATPPVAPAVCNALFRITGRRIRALPIKDYLLSRGR